MQFQVLAKLYCMTKFQYFIVNISAVPRIFGVIFFVLCLTLQIHDKFTVKYYSWSLIWLLQAGFFIFIIPFMSLCFLLDRFFWSVVNEMTLEEHKQLLNFTTGSDRVPVGGLAKLKFIIAKNGEDSDRYDGLNLLALYCHQIRVPIQIVLHLTPLTI